MLRRTCPICDSPLSRSARCCFAPDPLQKSRRNHCSYYMCEQMPYPAWFSCRHKSCPVYVTIGSLRNGVFERRPSTGSEVFFILKHLDAPKFVFLSVLTIIETSCPKKWAKSLLKNEKKHFRLTCVAEKASLLYKFTNYSPKRRWLVVLFTESAQRRGQYPPLATLR